MHGYRIDEHDAYLRYHDLPGREPVLVFLHGLGAASSSDFPETVRHPRLRDQRALLIDLLGYGYSDAPLSFDYTMESQAGLVARLLRTLSIRNAVVVGHSMGGSVAILLAGTEAQLVAHVMSAEGNLDSGPGFVSGRITAMSLEEFSEGGHAEFVRQVLRAGFADYAGTVHAADPVGLYQSAASLIAERSPSYREIFYGLSIPRTYIFGGQTLPDPDVEELAGQGVDVRIVPDAGHAMMVDNPNGFADAIADAIAHTN